MACTKFIAREYIHLANTGYFLSIFIEMQLRFPLYLSLVLLFHSPAKVGAQPVQSMEMSGDYGFVILHSQAIRPIGKSYPFAVGGEYSFWLLKDENWEDCNCFPRLGLNLSYHDFDNPHVLGFGLPLYGFIEPWYRLSTRWFFTLRGGMGYAYTSRPYDDETNPLNLSYSMYLNPYLMLGSGLAFRFSDHWRMGLQARYNHISNGGQQEPNKGINYPTANLSLSYSFEPLKFREREKLPLEEMEMQKSLISTAFIAGKSIDASRVTYAVPGAALRYSQQFGRTSAWVAGVEWIDNLAYRKRIEQEGLELSHHQVGVLAGHEFLLGNFVFSQMIGVYLYREYDIKPDWYQRYDLEWYFWKDFAAGTALKAHGHVAEFLDFRLSYRHRF